MDNNNKTSDEVSEVQQFLFRFDMTISDADNFFNELNNIGTLLTVMADISLTSAANITDLLTSIQLKNMLLDNFICGLPTQTQAKMTTKKSLFKEWLSEKMVITLLNRLKKEGTIDVRSGKSIFSFIQDSPATTEHEQLFRPSDDCILPSDILNNTANSNLPTSAKKKGHEMLLDEKENDTNINLIPDNQNVSVYSNLSTSAKHNAGGDSDHTEQEIHLEEENKDTNINLISDNRNALNHASRKRESKDTDIIKTTRTYSYSKEILDYVIVCPVCDMSAAANMFNAKFKCKASVSNCIVQKEKSRKNKTSITQTFTCTCNTNDIVFQLKHTNDDMAQTENGFGFRFKVFVKPTQFRETVMHFTSNTAITHNPQIGIQNDHSDNLAGKRNADDEIKNSVKKPREHIHEN
jgi:hypothetical protein